MILLESKKKDRDDILKHLVIRYYREIREYRKEQDRATYYYQCSQNPGCSDDDYEDYVKARKSSARKAYDIIRDCGLLDRLEKFDDFYGRMNMQSLQYKFRHIPDEELRNGSIQNSEKELVRYLKELENNTPSSITQTVADPAENNSFFKKEDDGSQYNWDALRDEYFELCEENSESEGYNPVQGRIREIEDLFAKYNIPIY